MGMKKIYERVYDNPLNKDGTKKPNGFLGYYELLEGDMSDYAYTCYVKNKNGELFELKGIEVSGFYGPVEKAGTRHVLTKLSEVPAVKAYIKYSKFSV